MEQQKKELIKLATTVVRKWGNSLAIRIPTEVKDHLKFINEGAEIEMIAANGELLVRSVYPESDDQESLRQHFLMLRSKSVPGTEAHEEMFAKPVGDEVI
ncbi:SpoVT / AbrB like domain protein [compost metagenome]